MSFSKDNKSYVSTPKPHFVTRKGCFVSNWLKSIYLYLHLFGKLKLNKMALILHLEVEFVTYVSHS